MLHTVHYLCPVNMSAVSALQDAWAGPAKNRTAEVS